MTKAGLIKIIVMIAFGYSTWLGATVLGNRTDITILKTNYKNIMTGISNIQEALPVPKKQNGRKKHKNENDD